MKAADKSTIVLLLFDRQRESPTVYTAGFLAHELLEENDAFDREYVIYSDGEVYINTCEGHASQVRQ